MTKIISSLQNSFIKNLLLLEEKPRARKEQNRIVIEGLREIRLALAGGFAITDLLYVSELVSMDELSSLINQVSCSFSATEITLDVFNRVAYRRDTGGVIALAEPRYTGFNDLTLHENPLLLVLETVEKPGNLGALLRTADAAALDAVIVCDPQTDIFNPNAIRSSIGCIFTMPVVVTSSEQAISWMHSAGIKMFGTALTATRFHHETDFNQPTAIVMGSESNGLSNTWLERADELIKIPMMGKIDSMNVSVSAAIVVFEALRQRNFHR